MAESPTEIQRLFELAKSGDRDAQGRLLEHFRPRLCELARGKIEGRLRARIDESDLAQQSCISALRNFHQFEGTDLDAFAAWLRRIHEQNVRDVIRDHTIYDKRAVSRETDYPQAVQAARIEPASPSHEAVQGERAARIAEALETLPESQREAVRLRHLEGCSLAEIARRLDRSEAATAGLLKRGLAKLREKLKDEREG
jgi:RNA polymerase sigma-70 factor (ECF subfamily)